MQKATIQLEPLTCPSCALKIEGAVKSLKGVNKESISVLFNASKLKLEFDDTVLSIGDIEKAVTTLGYEVRKSVVKPV